jgi:hypothetical protein
MSGVGWGRWGLSWGRRWYVEAPHIFAGSFRANKNTVVGSPGAKMESVVGVRRQEPEACRRGEMVRRE